MLGAGNVIIHTMNGINETRGDYTSLSRSQLLKKQGWDSEAIFHLPRGTAMQHCHC